MRIGFIGVHKIRDTFLTRSHQKRKWPQISESKASSSLLFTDYPVGIITDLNWWNPPLTTSAIRGPSTLPLPNETLLLAAFFREVFGPEEEGTLPVWIHYTFLSGLMFCFNANYIPHMANLQAEGFRVKFGWRRWLRGQRTSGWKFLRNSSNPASFSFRSPAVGAAKNSRSELCTVISFVLFSFGPIH